MRPRIIYMPQSDGVTKWHWVAEGVRDSAKTTFGLSSIFSSRSGFGTASLTHRAPYLFRVNM